MQITLTATVDEHRQLVLDVPAEIPLGQVEITVRPISKLTASEIRKLPQEEREKNPSSGCGIDER